MWSYDPEIFGGTPVFAGTRIPLKNVFNHLKRDRDLDEFLDAFPCVSRERAIAVLETLTRRHPNVGHANKFEGMK